ncbi:hypothetical protein FACS1894208_07950 [Clostridia bacterium]|nr:hypothetical protein FACS1894208_07950 [Clostridia bacterium]
MLSEQNEMDAMRKAIGKRITELREHSGLKRQGLSDAVNGAVSRSALEQLEKGISEPRAATILLLSRYFNVSADYILTGASPENLGAYQELGLNDTALAFWESQIDFAKNAGKVTAFSELLNAFMSDFGFFNLFWGLLTLNNELTALDKEISAVKDENPVKSDNTPETLLDEMQLDNQLEPLQERRDLLKLRYLKQVEKYFEQHIKGDCE